MFSGKCDSKLENSITKHDKAQVGERKEKEWVIYMMFYLFLYLYVVILPVLRRITAQRFMMTKIIPDINILVQETKIVN